MTPIAQALIKPTTYPFFTEPNISPLGQTLAGSTPTPTPPPNVDFNNLPGLPDPIIGRAAEISREPLPPDPNLLTGSMDATTAANAFQRNAAAAEAIPDEVAGATLAPGADPTWRDKIRDMLTTAGMSRHEIDSIVGGSTSPLGLGLPDVWFPQTAIAMAGMDALDAAAHGNAREAAIALIGAIPGGKAGKAAVKAAIPKHPTWRRAPRPSDIAPSSVDLPTIRGKSIPEAVTLAEPQPHLILGGEGSRGAYTGGPPNVRNYNDLKKLRQRVYDYIATEPRGGDWYDRYRAFLAEVTGANPLDNKTMAEMQALMSAGVDPHSELGFAIKELNATIAGMPVKAARPAQHETIQKAAEAQRAATTPEEMAAGTKMATGKKTGAYAEKINPDAPMSPDTLVQDPNSMIGHNQGPPMFSVPERVPGSTGVNDFRYGRTWEYTEPTGEPLKGALGPGAHKFIDYETTLMVDAANKHNLGGRSNWTGEQLQAAPWVKQKADDLMSRRPTLTPEAAMDEAMKTIADSAPARTLAATHEARPGVGLGYLPELDTASEADILAYSLDPRRSWATAPGGRDAIYEGIGIPNVGGGSPSGRTGFNMRVRPTIENQGAFQPPGGAMEFNRGEVARPLIGIDIAKGGKKSIAVADTAIAKAAERLRGLVDVQQASAAHIPFTGGRVKESGAWVVPLQRKLTVPEMTKLQALAKKHGFADVVDRGEGVTITSFYEGPPVLKGKQADVFIKELKQILPGEPQRAYTDSVYETMADEFLAGNSAASQKFLDSLVTPQLREAFDANPELARVMANKIAADEEQFGKQISGFGQKVTKMREIIGSGSGWVARLEDAVKKGVVPSVLAGGLFASMLAGRTPGEAPPNGGS